MKHNRFEREQSFDKHHSHEKNQLNTNPDNGLVSGAVDGHRQQPWVSNSVASHQYVIQFSGFLYRKEPVHQLTKVKRDVVPVWMREWIENKMLRLELRVGYSSPQGARRRRCFPQGSLGKGKNSGRSAVYFLPDYDVRATPEL